MSCPRGTTGEANERSDGRAESTRVGQPASRAFGGNSKGETEALCQPWASAFGHSKRPSGLDDFLQWRGGPAAAERGPVGWGRRRSR